MGETRYLCVEDVVALQDNILFRLNAPASPLIQPDKLESAILRCRNVAYYEGADLIRQAVALAIGISQAQAFLDGNKRAAFAATRSFLGINGLVYRGDPLDIARHLETVAEMERGPTRDAAVGEFEAWLREWVVTEAVGQ